MALEISWSTHSAVLVTAVGTEYSAKLPSESNYSSVSYFSSLSLSKSSTYQNHPIKKENKRALQGS
jgi:hypothetical protein